MFHLFCATFFFVFFLFLFISVGIDTDKSKLNFRGPALYGIDALFVTALQIQPVFYGCHFIRIQLHNRLRSGAVAAVCLSCKESRKILGRIIGINGLAAFRNRRNYGRSACCCLFGLCAAGAA